MADNDQDKTEYQSQKKLEQSREKGELPRSQELGTFVVFALILIYFSMVKLAWIDGLGAIMRDLLAFHTHMNITSENVAEFMIGPVTRGFMVVAPMFIMVLVVSPLTSMCMTGFNLAHDKLSPDLSKLNPINGLKRFMSLNQWLEGGKSAIKIGVFCWLAWLTIEKALPTLKLLPGRDLRDQLEVMFGLAIAIGMRVAILMAVLSIADFGWQWWQFYKKTLMTHQEMKDESKERDGNPLIKQRQRSLAMQRLRQNMMKEVPKASVVVTNPTHFAVALVYDRMKAPAPYVCAKGADHMAKRIRELAKQHGVPVIENRLLARALYRSVKVGKVIPADFYKAVAEVLAFVHMLKQKRQRGAAGRGPARDVRSRYI